MFNHQRRLSTNDMDERPKRNPHYATFASRLAQNSPNRAK